MNITIPSWLIVTLSIAAYTFVVGVIADRRGRRAGWIKGATDGSILQAHQDEHQTRHALTEEENKVYWDKIRTYLADPANVQHIKEATFLLYQELRSGKVVDVKRD